MSNVLLGLGIIYAVLTLNAFVPPRRVPILGLVAFIAGWLTTELAFHHAAMQAVAATLLVSLGALDHATGVVGLALLALSAVGLAYHGIVGCRAHVVLDGALQADLGPAAIEDLDAEAHARLAIPLPPARHVLPFAFDDGRVEVTRDLVYVEGGGRRHRLDVYRPRGGVTNAPVLFFVHGGAWVVGNKRHQAQPLLYHLAARGFVCVSANYRLSPWTTFPDCLIDVKRALAWTKHNVATFGGDPSFVVASGGSAGAHLASLIALTPCDPRYQPGFEAVDTTVAACVPLYGVYDLTNRAGQHPLGFVPLFFRAFVLEGRLLASRDALVAASPALHVTERAVPFFVVHGGSDSLAVCEDARHFVATLRAVSRNPVVYAELPHAQHAFEIFHSPRTTHTNRALHQFVEVIYARHRRAVSSGGGASSPASAAACGLPLTAA